MSELIAEQGRSAAVAAHVGELEAAVRSRELYRAERDATEELLRAEVTAVTRQLQEKDVGVLSLEEESCRLRTELERAESKHRQAERPIFFFPEHANGDCPECSIEKVAM